MALVRFVVVVVAVCCAHSLCHPGLRVKPWVTPPELWHNWTCATAAGTKPGSTAQAWSSATSWTHSATVTATSTPVQGITGNGSVPVSNQKKGFAYNKASYLSSFGAQGGSWAYNWKAQPDGALPPSLEYIPMCWGPGSAPACVNDIQAAISSGSAHLFSFNEPDHPSQANMTPQAAAALHVQIVDSLSTSAEIGSPAVTNGPPPMGISWLEQFLDSCGDPCPVDFITYHWYGAAQDLDGLRKHTEDVIDLARRHGIIKVWLTEFGADAGTPADKATFLEQAMGYLDNNPAVERYAFFMLSDGILLEGNRLSTLGEIYVRPP